MRCPIRMPRISACITPFSKRSNVSMPRAFFHVQTRCPIRTSSSPLHCWMMGVVGNGLSIVILLGRSLRHLSVYRNLAILCALNILYLSAVCIRHINTYHQDLRDASPELCRLHNLCHCVYWASLFVATGLDEHSACSCPAQLRTASRGLMGETRPLPHVGCTSFVIDSHVDNTRHRHSSTAVHSRWSDSVQLRPSPPSISM